MPADGPARPPSSVPLGRPPPGPARPKANEVWNGLSLLALLLTLSTTFMFTIMASPLLVTMLVEWIEGV